MSAIVRPTGAAHRTANDCSCMKSPWVKVIENRPAGLDLSCHSTVRHACSPAGKGTAGAPSIAEPSTPLCPAFPHRRLGSGTSAWAGLGTLASCTCVTTMASRRISPVDAKRQCQASVGLRIAFGCMGDCRRGSDRHLTGTIRRYSQ